MRRGAENPEQLQCKSFRARTRVPAEVRPRPITGKRTLLDLQLRSEQP